VTHPDEGRRGTPRARKEPRPGQSEPTAGTIDVPGVSGRLIALIVEYTAKLHVKLAEDEMRSRRTWSLFTVILALVAALAAAVPLLPYLQPRVSTLPPTIVFGRAAAAAAIAGLIYAVGLWGREVVRARASRHGLVRTAASLRKLVANASQFREHSTIESVRRIELEVRIAEAEALIRQFDETPQRFSWLEAVMPWARRRAADRAARSAARWSSSP
jgi:hypothetical protein